VRSDTSKNVTKWKWDGGPATALADFLDPATTMADTISVCIYDNSGAGQPVTSSAVAGVGTCNGKPCWKAAGSKAFRYKDKTAGFSGIKFIKLKSGDTGKSKIIAKTKGAFFTSPVPPVSLPATIQMIINDGTTSNCWQATYSQSIKNQTGILKAKSD